MHEESCRREGWKFLLKVDNPAWLPEWSFQGEGSACCPLSSTGHQAFGSPVGIDPSGVEIYGFTGAGLDLVHSEMCAQRELVIDLEWALDKQCSPGTWKVPHDY
jgi:hypothetical protein